jgi:hypothetical protein
MNSINLNGFSLEILTQDGPAEKFIFHNKNYVSLPNKTEYSLKLGNDLGVRADAHVWINNEKVGIWRINPYSHIIVERDGRMSEKFILSKADSCGDTQPNGFIKVQFKPEMISDYEPSINYCSRDDLSGYDRFCQNNSMRCPSYSDTVTPCHQSHQSCNMNIGNYCRYVGTNLTEGATIIGSHTYQKFRKVTPLHNIDHSKITYIYALLVIDETCS